MCGSIEGWKEIAAALGVSEDTAQRLAGRAVDPLPVKNFNGRRWARTDELTAWAHRVGHIASVRMPAAACG